MLLDPFTNMMIVWVIFIFQLVGVPRKAYKSMLNIFQVSIKLGLGERHAALLGRLSIPRSCNTR